jgi:hypothetical protein
MIRLIKRLIFGASPSRAWYAFGKEVNSVYKKQYEDLLEFFSKISNYRK